MIRTTRAVEVATFTSSVRPDVSTEDAALAGALEWADAHPVAYRIVTGTLSAVFGRRSVEYLGSDRDAGDDDPDRVAKTVRRLAHLRESALKDGLFGWRVRFALAHYEDSGFRGDVFRLWDGEVLRCALPLDHTPATLEEVLDQYAAWCDPCYRRVEVRVGKRVVRRFQAVETAVDPLS